VKKDVATLLALLQRENERENAKGPLTQEIRAPEKMPRRVPTLDGGGRPLSPMLRARFAFAGRWQNAILGQTWLSASEMARAPKTRDLVEEVALRRESWTRSLVSKLPLDRLSLFAVDVDDGDATYLVWGKGAEPKVLELCGASEKAYKDFATYLAAHLGTFVTSGKGTNAAPPVEASGLVAYLADDKSRLDLWIGGLERWGQPIVARAAIAAARLVLSTLPIPRRQKVATILGAAAQWADEARGELPASFSYALNAARPVSPAIDGKKVFEAMHACVQAANSATAYHLEKPIVIYADSVKAALLEMRKLESAEVARALNSARLRTPSGAAWKPDTAKKALSRLEATLEHARLGASATVEHVIAALGKSAAPKIREAVRNALGNETALTR
jgi:hypothetical protein